MTDKPEQLRYDNVFDAITDDKEDAKRLKLIADFRLLGRELKQGILEYMKPRDHMIAEDFNNLYQGKWGPAPDLLLYGDVETIAVAKREKWFSQETLSQAKREIGRSINYDGNK